MFKTSIKTNSKFLLPFLQGKKGDKDNNIVYNIGTMIVLNEHGALLTCKHIADEIINSSDNNTSMIHWFFNIEKGESFDIIVEEVATEEVAAESAE